MAQGGRGVAWRPSPQSCSWPRAATGSTSTSGGVYTAQPTTTITGDVTVANGQALVSLTANGVRTGVGMEMTGGGLAFTFDPPAAGDLEATIVKNPDNIPPALIDQVFGQLIPQLFGAVQDVLSDFPLPGFAGRGLTPVEISRVGSGFVLFADLVPAG